MRVRTPPDVRLVGVVRRQNPGGRRLYNFYLTAVSSLVAVGVGSIELLGCLQRQCRLKGRFWDVVQRINDNFEYVGYTIIAFFALSAVAALAHARCSQTPRGPIVLDVKRGSSADPSSPGRGSGGAGSAQKAPPVWWRKRRWG